MSCFAGIRRLCISARKLTDSYFYTSSSFSATTNRRIRAWTILATSCVISLVLIDSCNLLATATDTVHPKPLFVTPLVRTGEHVACFVATIFTKNIENPTHATQLHPSPDHHHALQVQNRTAPASLCPQRIPMYPGRRNVRNESNCHSITDTVSTGVLYVYR